MIVALIMVALLMAAAFTIDVGAMLFERGQLQNGADAAALAVAGNCATGTCGNTTATAQTFANQNANDGAANVASVSEPTANSVRVVLSTKDGSTGNGFLTLPLGSLLGVNTKTVTAAATASWGVPASGPDHLAMAFAPCVFLPNGGMQVIGIAGGGVNNCSSTSPSGQLIPGGFSWLADPTNTCTANVSTASPATGGSTGVSISSPCQAVLSTLANKTILLPVYSDVTGTGSGAQYTISGFAAFTVLGWNFVGSGGSSYNNSTYPGYTCTGNCKGIIGQFVKFVSLDDAYTTGSASNLGAQVVSLSQ
ncbi:pilus assembly protein TadG-related protein [Curtobacterium ammoniigenes]|uniref:pilus assembly protein TadG-related protein n=1 Tax=Curtobacterium ammoniigenes TaxID=395387 RepID=UPI0008352F57|nr:pilus assembly protein TadG-related protein [Curtobacterium ammoniigenes]